MKYTLLQVIVIILLISFCYHVERSVSNFFARVLARVVSSKEPPQNSPAYSSEGEEEEDEDKK